MFRAERRRVEVLLCLWLLLGVVSYCNVWCCCVLCWVFLCCVVFAATGVVSCVICVTWELLLATHCFVVGCGLGDVG